MGLSQSFFAERFGITERDLESYLSEALSARRRLCRPLFRIPRHQLHRHRRMHRQERDRGRHAGRRRARHRGRAHRLRLQRRSEPRENPQSRARGGAASRTGPASVVKTGFEEAHAAQSLSDAHARRMKPGLAERVELVKRADRAARAYDPRVFQVQATYADSLRHVLVATSDGLLSFDRQPMARMSVMRAGAGRRWRSAARIFRRRRARDARFLPERKNAGTFRAAKPRARPSCNWTRWKRRRAR